MTPNGRAHGRDARASPQWRMNPAPAPLNSTAHALSALGITVLERGWLSSNNILMRGASESLVVDTGYATHAEQTVALVREWLDGRPLGRVLNTHLHSDHCGGNAALHAAWPAARIAIPPGQAQAVRDWDMQRLTHGPTGQQCPRFAYDELLQPGDQVVLGSLTWDVHAAPGHDPEAILLHEPAAGVLISGDALWGNGFGVVFPELDGADGFDEVARTLNLIESLGPSTVIPGHGPAFGGLDVALALDRARTRLTQFVSDPTKHRWHALKVLVKFKLLELQRVERARLLSWFSDCDYFLRIARLDRDIGTEQLLNELLHDLERAGALRIEGAVIVNS